MARFKREDLTIRHGIELFAIVSGLGLSIFGVVRDELATATIGFVLVLVPYILVDKYVGEQIRKAFVGQLKEIMLRLDRIDRYLKASSADKLEIAIFDDLLIYLPLYVAKESGFLEQEGIEVKFKLLRGDREVAEAIKKSSSVIGLCDPCMCALKEFSQAGDSLRILAPLVIQRAAKPVTRHALRVHAKLIKGGEIKIGTYPAPSTTFVMAVDLMNRLQLQHAARYTSKLTITIIPEDPEQFNKDSIPNLLEKYDLLMLWDPLLTYAGNLAEVVEFRLQDDSEPTEEMIYSAVVISDRLLEEKPTLGIRLFRAISRATSLIHLAASSDMIRSRYTDSSFRNEVIHAAISHISASPLEADKLSALIRKITSEGLFPLVMKPERLQELPVWKNRLYNAIRRRQIAAQKHPENFPDELQHIANPEECRAFYCADEVFKPVERVGIR